MSIYALGRRVLPLLVCRLYKNLISLIKQNFISCSCMDAPLESIKKTLNGNYVPFKRNPGSSSPLSCNYTTAYLPSHKPSKTNKKYIYWRNKDEIISEFLLCTRTHGCASVGRPVRIYIHQICTDTGYSLEDLPGSIDYRDWWRDVTYWPSRQSRNRCIRSKISWYSLDRGRVDFGANVTFTGSRWVTNNDITRCDRKFS